eukprot:s2973_g6.t1
MHDPFPGDSSDDGAPGSYNVEELDEALERQAAEDAQRELDEAFERARHNLNEDVQPDSITVLESGSAPRNKLQDHDAIGRAQADAWRRQRDAILDEGTFDQIESPQDFALMDPSEEAITEETQLDEALAQSVLQGEPILPDGLTRGNVWQNFEDLRGVPEEDADERQAEGVDVEPPQEDDDEPSYGLLDGPGPLASIFENDVAEGQAERGFWRKVDREARDAGFEVSRIFPRKMKVAVLSEVTCVLTTHVDDFLWASKGVGGSIVNKLLEKFEVGHDVVIDVTDNTNKIHYIEVKSNRRHSDLIDRGEERQLRSVVGSLSWISRQARPDILYRVSKLQSSIKGATVATLREANKVLEIALKGKTLKLRYRNGPFDFENLGVLTASDASFAGESKDRSQQGRVHFLAPANQLTSCSEYDVMVVSFSSTTIKRVCRATLQAETYALQSAQESGDRIRAALAELYGNGSKGADWDLRARMRVPHVCLTDCRSLSDHLNTDTPSRVQDKRLQTELSALRQSVFTDIGERSCKAYPCGGDRVDWIDAATQAADCLTKSMKPDFIIKVIETGYISHSARFDILTSSVTLHLGHLESEWLYHLPCFAVFAPPTRERAPRLELLSKLCQKVLDIGKRRNPHKGLGTICLQLLSEIDRRRPVQAPQHAPAKRAFSPPSSIPPPPPDEATYFQAGMRRGVELMADFAHRAFVDYLTQPPPGLGPSMTHQELLLQRCSVAAAELVLYQQYQAQYRQGRADCRYGHSPQQDFSFYHPDPDGHSMLMHEHDNCAWYPSALQQRDGAGSPSRAEGSSLPEAPHTPEVVRTRSRAEPDSAEKLVRPPKPPAKAHMADLDAAQNQKISAPGRRSASGVNGSPEDSQGRESGREGASAMKPGLLREPLDIAALAAFR